MNLLYIDLFCGAGGTSTGVESAKLNGNNCAKVIACVNHDKNAIASHASNHPKALHFTEDIRTLELSTLVAHTKNEKRKNKDALLVLWASLECTNFSKAKGGKPRDADSRTLAEHLFRYIDALNPDYIQIENVEEFMSWGPMDEKGKPISMDKGKDYIKWVKKIKSYGYDYEYRILNSANYGAYTARKRFFGIFAKKGLPIVFPEQTHSKNIENSLFNNFKKWKAVKDVLDLNDNGESIFGRKKQLSDKTYERIFAGLIKFIAGGKDKWLLKYNSINGKTGNHIPPSIDESCLVVSCQGRLGLVSCSFLARYNTVKPENTIKSLDEPCGVVTTHNRFAKVQCDFLTAYYGNGHNHSVNSPCPTVTTVDRFALIKPQFIDLVSTEKGMSIKVEETDTPIMIKIKEFMLLYSIADIKMRMLKISELKQIMGFPKNYILVGTQVEQKKYIGNAVEVTMAKVLCEALCNELVKLNKVA